MTANEKVAQKKHSLLELAEELSSVSDACRIMKVSRSQFYEVKRAFQTGGLEALLDKPPVPGASPHKLPEETEMKIGELSVEHPAWGQQRVRDELIPHGIVVSVTTVRNVWVRHNLDSTSTPIA